MRTSTASTRAYVATSGLRRRSTSSPIRSTSADSPIPVRRSVSAARSAPTPRSRSRGSTWSRHMGCISRGGPGSATTTRPSASSSHQPGAVPFGLGSGGRSVHQPGLLQVRLDEGQAAALEQAAQPGLQLGVHPWPSPGGLRDRLAGQVVRRWPQAAGRDDDVRPFQRSREGVRDHIEAVRKGRGAEHLHAERGQLARQIAAVGVARLADEQLRPDAQQLGAFDGSGHAPTVRQMRRLVPTTLVARRAVAQMCRCLDGRRGGMLAIYLREC